MSRITVSAGLSILLVCSSLACAASDDPGPANESRVTGKAVPATTRAALEAIAKAAGEAQIRVTSVSRSAEDQIRIVFENYTLAGAKATYGLPCRLAFDEPTRAAMVIKLRELLKQEPRPTCMRHVETDGSVVDIAPSSVSDLKGFYEAVMNSDAVDSSRFYYPTIEGVPTSPVKDNAFHIELK